MRQLVIHLATKPGLSSKALNERAGMCQGPARLFFMDNNGIQLSSSMADQ